MNELMNKCKEGATPWFLLFPTSASMENPNFLCNFGGEGDVICDAIWDAIWDAI